MFSNRRCPEANVNMTGRDKGKQSEVGYENSNVMPPTSYRSLAWDCKLSRNHSSIAESKNSNSSEEGEVTADMASNPEEMAHEVAIHA